MAVSVTIFAPPKSRVFHVVHAGPAATTTASAPDHAPCSSCKNAPPENPSPSEIVLPLQGELIEVARLARGFENCISFSVSACPGRFGCPNMTTAIERAEDIVQNLKDPGRLPPRTKSYWLNESRKIQSER